LAATHGKQSGQNPSAKIDQQAVTCDACANDHGHDSDHKDEFGGVILERPVCPFAKQSGNLGLVT